MFRRRTDAPQALVTDDLAPSAPARQAGKGRATPKRSEVERRRREPYAPPPADRKTAAAQRRTRQQSERSRRMEAMRRGEDWAMRPADRGAVRALARDYIDSRRIVVSEYILLVVFVLILAVFLTGAAKNSSAVLYIELGILLLIAAESTFHAVKVGRLARQRYPGASTRGLTWYIAKRAIKFRSARIPPPRLSRGEPIK